MWFSDEARIGQRNPLTRVWARRGSRPVASKDQRFSSAYIFGAVCPAENKAAALVMPVCDTFAMNCHLAEISAQVGADAHGLVVIDGAGWHKSDDLIIPDNLTLLILPPYSPELNPAERIWRYLRSHWLSNRVFADIGDVMDACVDAWKRFTATPGLIGSLCHVSWATPSQEGG